MVSRLDLIKTIGWILHALPEIRINAVPIVKCVTGPIIMPDSNGKCVELWHKILVILSNFYAVAGCNFELYKTVAVSIL